MSKCVCSVTVTCPLMPALEASHAERKKPWIGQPSRYAEGKNMCQGENKFTRREEEASDGAAEQAF